MKKSIRDIAREAGVSIATVSRVCNHPSLVAEETRERVTRLLHQANLHPSDSRQFGRRGIRERGTGRIGLLVPDTPHPSVEAINEAIFKGARRVALSHGAEVVLDFYRPDSDAPLMIPKMAGDNHWDGLLLRTAGDAFAVQRLVSTRLDASKQNNVILVGNSFDVPDMSSVMEDNAAGMQMALDYLSELGHRVIGFVGGPLERLFNHRCLQSYREGMKRRGFPCEARLIKIFPSVSASPEEVTSAMGCFLDEMRPACATSIATGRSVQPAPTAIVCTTDGHAAGLIAAARRRGVQVPADLSIVSRGNLYYAALTDPPLTTVDINLHAIGEVGAALLLLRIGGARCATQTLVRPTLVERRSCAAVKPVSGER